MEEENKTETPAGAPQGELFAGKFKSVDALLHAYGELEAEFTRRSQRLKALEEQLSPKEEPQAAHAQAPRASTQEEPPEGSVYPPRGVPLMGAGGAGVIAPHQRPASIAEAGALALGYLKRQKP